MQAMKDSHQAAEYEYDDGNEVGVRLGKGRLPSAEKQQRGNRSDRYHVGVLSHEKGREAHAAVFGMEAGYQLIFGFGQIERHSIGFRETRNHKNGESYNLGEHVPARNETQTVAALIVNHLAAAECD